MQIEQFDTGLKTKTNVQNIILSPEENLENKNLVRGYLNKIVTSGCLLYTSPSPRDMRRSRMPSSA